VDDAARRVNPAQLRALLRCRVAREDEAARELLLARADKEDAQVGLAGAEAAAAAHHEGRRGREQALIGTLVGQVQHARRVLAVQHAVERMAQEAVNLADVAADAGRILQQSEEMLADARALHAQRAREVHKWRTALNRVETAQRGYAAAQEETELEDDLSDRHARRPPPAWA